MPKELSNDKQEFDFTRYFFFIKLVGPFAIRAIAECVNDLSSRGALDPEPHFGQRHVAGHGEPREAMCAYEYEFDRQQAVFNDDVA
ncbi:hypothetical protein Hte_000428 [Hypoxylon texense]